MSNEALKVPLDLLKKIVEKVVEAVLKELLSERPHNNVQPLPAYSAANSSRGYKVYKPLDPISEQKQQRYEQVAAEDRRNNAEKHKLGQRLHSKLPEVLNNYANYRAVNKQLGDYAHEREAHSLKLKR